MVARDPNGATWYVLRYPENFRPRPPQVGIDPAPPSLDATLLYDDSRGVLELAPVPPDHPAEPLPGLAFDVDGDVYFVDPKTGALLVRQCDGSTAEVVCEPGVFAWPRGLALDRRGLLYVADSNARRVVVVSPEDGTVRAVLNGGMLYEPVDVAVAQSGWVYVADRGGLDENGQPRAGQIVVYGARLQRLGRFVPADPQGVLSLPRPIAVMVDDDGTILVADASFPRLLRFGARGEPLGDVATATALRAAFGSETKPYGDAMPRFRALSCGTSCAAPLPEVDGQTRLVAAHRALRLRALALSHQFAPSGVFASAALDAGVPGTTWHRIELEVVVPAGTQLYVETTTSDSIFNDPLTQLFDPSLAVWDGPRDADGNLVAVTPGVDQLVQSPPGRFLWVRVTFESDGTDTPSVEVLRVYYPRVSYLDLLPRVWRRDPESAFFLEHFLSLFEHVLTEIEERYEDFTRELNPDAAPPGVIDWLASLIDLAFDPSWPLEKRRKLVAEAVNLYARRGTPDGIARFVEIYVGARPTIIEWFLERPTRPPVLGVGRAVLGTGARLDAPIEDLTPEQQLFARYAHRFSVLVPMQDFCDDAVLAAVVDRIITLNKPAHTYHTLRLVHPGAEVGQTTRLGIDFVLGDDPPPRVVPGGKSGQVLGRDTVLGARRPEYLTKLIPELQ